MAGLTRLSHIQTELTVQNFLTFIKVLHLRRFKNKSLLHETRPLDSDTEDRHYDVHGVIAHLFLFCGIA